MTDREQRGLIDRYLDAYNAFDVDGMMAPLHPGIEFENVADGTVNASASGTDAFRQMAEQATGLFTSRRQTVTSFEGDQNRATIGVAYEGVLAIGLPNGMRAGETLRLTGRSEFEFEDGLIARIRDIS